MAIGWYIIPYKRRVGHSLPARYPAIDDYSPQIHEAGGQWAETEVLGNRCIVKVRAPAAILQALNNVDGFGRIPKDRLDDPLSDLPNMAKVALRNEVLTLGYTAQELRDRFGDDISQYTLRDVLRFMARRRLKPRYDAQSDEIVLDGDIQQCRSIESVDAEVSE